MQKFLRGFFVLLLLLLGVSIAAAEAPRSSDVSSRDGFFYEQTQSDEATVRIIPDEGEVGAGFTILISDLAANETVTVRIILAETETQVYETTRSADERGRLEIEIFTESSDSAGVYRVEILNADDAVIGTGEFVLEAVAGREGVLSVSPSEGELSTSFVFEISEVQAFADLLIIVTNEAGEEVFSTGIRATVDGTASVTFENASAATGTLSVQVLQNETFPVASGSFMVQGQVFPATIALDPNPAMPNDEVFVTVSGLEADTVATVVISNEAGVLLSQEITGNVSGLAIFSFVVTPEMALGDYQLQVLQGETVLAQSAWLLDIPAPTVTISPTVGVPSSYFLVEVGALLPDEAVLVELTQGETVLQSFTVTSDAEGNARAILGQRLRLTVGDYGVQVVRGGQIVFSQAVSIVAEREAPETTAINPDDVTVSVSPASGIRPTNYEIRIEGVPADTDLTLVIIYDGTAVYTFEATADADGIALTGINSEATDPIGVYTLEVRVDGQVIGSADFEIANEEAQVEPTAEPTEEPETPSGDVTLTVEPETVPQGARFEIFVTNLAAGETVTVELRFAGDTLYTSEQSADSNGALALALRTDSNDELGQYEIVILRAGEEIASSQVSLVASDTAINTAEISISPESAPQGASHTINVSGLSAGETVTVAVSFEGTEVYSVERAADAQGVVTVVLSTNGADAVGQYNVTVTHANGGLIGSFIVTEGETITEPEPPNLVSIGVEPESGIIGTNHTVTVTGLEAEEAVSVTVEVDGEVVYETSGVADADGLYRLVLATEEGDARGEYTVTVERANGDELTTEFLVESETPVVGSDLVLSIDPSEINTNENFNINVSGLDAAETVSIEVLYEGESVYETEREADENGELIVPLALESTDPTGTYTIEVRRANGDVASAELQVNGDVPDNVGGGDGENGEEPGQSSDGTVVLGESYTGELTANAPEARFTFVGEEGQGIQIDASSEDFDTYLSLLDANGDEIAYNDDGAGGLDSRISINLPYDGEYTIIVTSFSQVIGTEPEVGDFSLSVQEAVVADDTVELESGNQVVTSSLTTEVPEVKFVFEGEAGTMVLISAEAANFDTYLTLLDENGNIIASNDDSNGSLNSQIGPFELPTDGQYTAVVSSFSYSNYEEVATGEFTFRIESVELTETTYDETLTLEISAETASHFISFTGQAGDVIAVSVNSNDSVDTTLTLLDSTGYVLDSDDDGGLGFDPEIERYVLTSDGEYILMLRAFTLGDSGEVELNVHQIDERSLDDGENTIRLNSKQYLDMLVFEGVAGETVNLVLTLDSGAVGSFYVSATQGDSSLLTYQSSGMRDSITLSFRVPENGTVLISVQDNSSTNVILSVELVRD